MRDTYPDLWRTIDSKIERKDGTPMTLADRVAFLAKVGLGCRYDLRDRLEKGEITPEAAQASVVVPNRPHDARTSGSDDIGTPNRSHSCSDHMPAPMS